MLRGHNSNIVGNQALCEAPHSMSSMVITIVRIVWMIQGIVALACCMIFSVKRVWIMQSMVAYPLLCCALWCLRSHAFHSHARTSVEPLSPLHFHRRPPKHAHPCIAHNNTFCGWMFACDARHGVVQRVVWNAVENVGKQWRRCHPLRHVHHPSP